MDEKEKLIQHIRGMLRTKPDLTAGELKKAHGGTSTVAFYSVLLQEARKAEEAVGEQLAGEDAEAEKATKAKKAAQPDFFLIEDSNQVVKIKWEAKKGNRVYFRRE